MNFELLPDEIILDLFDFLDGSDLIYAFYGLNSRFYWLLYKQYCTFHFNFNSISKRKFDMICQRHLPIIADRVISLSLSNDDETPQQIDLFLTYIPLIQQFTYLRALSLSGIRTHEIIMNILEQCQHLCHLTSFRFNASCMSGNAMVYQSIIDQIWNLPKLTHCHFNCLNDSGLNTWIPTKISSSIKSLALSSNATRINRINYLFERTPHLKYLSIKIYDSENDYTANLYPTLVNLDIYVSNASNTSNIIALLQNMTNLRVLNIELPSNIIVGYQWEQIISKHLPKLKKLHFKMEEKFSLCQNITKRMNELIDSFRKTFWIDEHQWFVRCFHRYNTLYLYTLPYTLPFYSDTFPDAVLSTDPTDNLQRFCNDITQIFEKTFFEQIFPSNIRFTNLQHLSINFPMNQQFWSIVPCLDRLKSLTIYVDIDITKSQVQTLFDRTPNLYKLTIYNTQTKFWNIDLFKCTAKSVRYLNLYHLRHLYNEEECLQLAHSSLAAQCEILVIQTNNYECIVGLINNMMNLRVLIVHCKYDLYSNSSLPLDIDTKTHRKIVNWDKTIEWLKENLPSICLISSKKPCASKCDIRIWMS